MNTATLTFHASNNNGSFLQAYALQKTLRSKMNIANTIIDFRTDRQMRQYSIFRRPHSMGDILRNGISAIHYRKLCSRFRRFEEMRNRYLQMTKRCETEKSAYEIAKGYDVVICGSDQIWNTAARDFSEIYFYPLPTNKKMTYAVSCGFHIPEGNGAKFIEWASKFDYLSVREPSLAEFLKNKGMPKAEIVLDPTFLLDRSDYEELYEPEMIMKGRYIFLYTINYNDDILRAAQKLAMASGLPIYAPFTGYSAVKCHKYGIKILYDVAPDKFLNLIHHATYICTNSFHGIAFSIIYEKDFFRPYSADMGGQLIPDDRIDGILGILGIQNRNIPEDNMEVQPLDYSEIAEKLKTLRKQSIDYLAKALRDA